MRRLVVSFIITVGNYDYAFYWYLYQDGTIEAEVKATGILLTQGLAFDARNYGATVEPDLVAPHHQHFFCVRLDMEVDGECNSVYEVDTASVADKDTNPHGNAFRPVVTRLEREPEAHRTIDPFSGRHWLIVNDSVRNALDQPVAYKLLPGATVPPFAREDSDLLRRAGFLKDNLWVTHYDQRERFRPATTQTSIPVVPGSRSISGRTVQSSRMTSCSGTRSGCCTSPAPRTGR